MNNQRPVNLDLRKFHFPIMAIVSILHRISGVFLFLAIPLLLMALESSLVSESAFSAIKNCLTSGIWPWVVWLLLTALVYHLVAGLRHLLMDLGFAEDLSSGRMAAYIVLTVSAIAAVVLGGWLLW